MPVKEIIAPVTPDGSQRVPLQYCETIASIEDLDGVCPKRDRDFRSYFFVYLAFGHDGERVFFFSGPTHDCFRNYSSQILGKNPASFLEGQININQIDNKLSDIHFHPAEKGLSPLKKRLAMKKILDSIAPEMFENHFFFYFFNIFSEDEAFIYQVSTGKLWKRNRPSPSAT
jgi:hypothetical protein